MSSLTKLNISEMRAGLLSGEFSAVELVDSHIKRTEETNESLNSFITISSESARESAKEADKLLKEKGADSPLFTGIPVAIKDQLVTKGIRTTCGSKMLSNFIPPYDCTAVRRLKEKGAVVIGKTNQDEFAMGSSNEHSFFGPCKNPWDLSRVPGGSSGGSAVAVAAGQSPVSLGTDTGGSIRQPASLTGVYGLKPTYGRVSRYGAVAFASSLDQIGPFARTPRDLAYVMEVISGFDKRDSTSMKVDVPKYAEELDVWKDKDLKGIRIGVPKEVVEEGIEKSVYQEFLSVKEKLVSLGAELVEVSLPHAEHSLAAYYITAPAEASSNLARFDGIRYGHRSSEYASLEELYSKSRAEGFGSEVKRRIMIGSFVLSSGYYDAYYKKAQQIRTLIVNDYRAAFTNCCDVILTPVSPTTAFKIGEKSNASPLAMYLADIFTVPINLAGLPGISIPTGLSGENLPIGMQLVGPFFSESLLLGLSSVFERERSFPVLNNTKNNF